MTPSTINMYPAGFDFAWLAIDKNQHVALFITAGEGSIPIDHLNAPTEVFKNKQGSGLLLSHLMFMLFLMFEKYDNKRPDPICGGLQDMP